MKNMRDIVAQTTRVNFTRAFVAAALCSLALAASNTFAAGISSENTWGHSYADIQVGESIDQTPLIIQTAPLGELLNLEESDAAGRHAQTLVQTDIGINRLFVTASSPVGDAGIAFAEGISTWNEQFVITGGTGTGTVTINARLSAAWLGRLDQPFNSLTYSVFYFPDTDTTTGETYASMVISDGGFAADPTAEQGVLDMGLSGTFTFDYDRPFFLQTELRASVSGNATWDAFHTAEITGFMLPAGSQLTNAGGPDVLNNLHVAAVPVPAAAWLLGSGLIALIGVAWRKAA
jgi:hypothetical protein